MADQRVVVMTDGYDNNRLQRCACVCGTSLGILSAGRIPIMVIGQIGRGGGPVVYIHLAGVVALGSIPDVIGLTGRRPDAAESRILQGRDVRSVSVLVPDSRALDQTEFS